MSPWSPRTRPRDAAAASADASASSRAALHADGGSLAEKVQVIIATFCRRPIRIATLLGLKDEAVALVAVDPPEALRPVAIVLKYAALEDVVVVIIISLAAGRGWHAQKVAKAINKALGVCEFGAARIAPMGYKMFNVCGVSHLDQLRA